MEQVLPGRRVDNGDASVRANGGGGVLVVQHHSSRWLLASLSTLTSVVLVLLATIGHIICQ